MFLIHCKNFEKKSSEDDLSNFIAGLENFLFSIVKKSSKINIFHLSEKLEKRFIIENIPNEDSLDKIENQDVPID